MTRSSRASGGRLKGPQIALCRDSVSNSDVGCPEETHTHVFPGRLKQCLEPVNIDGLFSLTFHILSVPSIEKFYPGALKIQQWGKKKMGIWITGEKRCVNIILMCSCVCEGHFSLESSLQDPPSPVAQSTGLESDPGAPMRFFR